MSTSIFFGRMFKDIDLQEIPPLVYQLLLLASKVCVNLKKLLFISNNQHSLSIQPGWALYGE